jgi:hypothetical protein
MSSNTLRKAALADALCKLPSHRKGLSWGELVLTGDDRRKAAEKIEAAARDATHELCVEAPACEIEAGTLAKRLRTNDGHGPTYSVTALVELARAGLVEGRAEKTKAWLAATVALCAECTESQAMDATRRQWQEAHDAYWRAENEHLATLQGLGIDPTNPRLQPGDLRAADLRRANHFRRLRQDEARGGPIPPSWIGPAPWRLIRTKADYAVWLETTLTALRLGPDTAEGESLGLAFGIKSLTNAYRILTHADWGTSAPPQRQQTPATRYEAEADLNSLYVWAAGRSVAGYASGKSVAEKRRLAGPDLADLAQVYPGPTIGELSARIKAGDASAAAELARLMAPVGDAINTAAAPMHHFWERLFPDSPFKVERVTRWLVAECAVGAAGPDLAGRGLGREAGAGAVAQDRTPRRAGRAVHPAVPGAAPLLGSGIRRGRAGDRKRHRPLPGRQCEPADTA